MIICTRPLTLGRPNARLAEPIMRERMRLSRLAFDRGLAGDFRARKDGGPRHVLPLVARPGTVCRWCHGPAVGQVDQHDACADCMRPTRLAFNRGLVGDFRPHSPRRLLPLVARPVTLCTWCDTPAVGKDGRDDVCADCMLPPV